MRLGASCLALSSLLAMAFLAAGQGDPTMYAIVDVTVIDVAEGVGIPGQTVIVVGDRIERMGPIAEIELPGDASILDGRGLYLMPGLVDAHVHFLDASTFAPLMIANGITLVRDTGMPTDFVLEVRDRLNRGELVGPEMVATGAILDGYPPIIPSISVGRTKREWRFGNRRPRAST
jgi:hypothetical protein